MLFDTHAHVYSEYYNNIKDVIKKSQAMGVTNIISDGVDMVTNKELINICDKYPSMYITIGIHPENVNDYNEENMQFIKDNIKNIKVVAIGEIGLDYHYENFDRKKQISLFEEQLKIAQDNKIPVVVHSREATLDTLTSLKKFKVTGVIHCFSGSYETALEYIKMGFKLGVNGVVTFKNSKIKEVIKKVGIKNIVLETDSPYLTPEPNRGTKNFPGNTMIVAEFLANYLEVPKNELIQQININTYSIFDRINPQ